MKPLVSILIISALLGTCLTAVAAQDVRPAAGSVVLARTGTTATYLWNATPYVAQLVSDKHLGAEGMQQLEATAISVLKARAETSKSATLKIQVVYERTGSVSSVYGTPTFAGVERVCTLQASRAELHSHGDAWIASIAAGNVPPQVSLTVTGVLPPAN